MTLKETTHVVKVERILCHEFQIKLVADILSEKMVIGVFDEDGTCLDKGFDSEDEAKMRIEDGSFDYVFSR